MRIEDEIKQATFENEYQKLAVNLLYTQKRFETLFEQALAPYSISPEQFNVLRILKGKHPKPMGIKDIQERMLNKMSNTSRLVEKLKQKGLVERIACERDRRAVDVTLTPEGIEHLTVLNEVAATNHRRFASLSEKEAQTLNHLLDKLRG
ncbi:MAG: MarR family transcriptional regulator [Trueperaceae bacterium]|nr:MAG: MarR family transcriptional regulator [Trueperaceae bacterium]